MSAESHRHQSEHVQPPTSAELFDEWSHRIERLNQEIDQGVVQRDLPEWWHDGYVETRDMTSSLQQEDAEPSNISKWYELRAKEVEAKNRIAGEGRYMLGAVHPIDMLEPEVVAKGFLSEREDGPIHADLLNSLGRIAKSTSGVPVSQLRVLQRAYGAETITGLLGIKGADYEKQIHNVLLEPNIMRWIRHKDMPRGKEDDEWAERQAVARQWMASALEVAAGIPHDEAMNYVFSSSRTCSDVGLIEVIKKFHHFGADRIRRLTHATGIVGLEAYSVRQLERMERFATDPAEFASSLHDHDASVMFINRVGDHNGVLSELAATFDDEDKDRMMFFEIASASNILRTMSTLHKHGIKPSTLVLSAHSNPGKFAVADQSGEGLPRYDTVTVFGRQKVAMLNADTDSQKDVRHYSMHGMSGFAYAVEHYMAPSRSVDDNALDRGRKKIIFIACDAATEVERFDTVGGDGRDSPLGAESVISQLGKDLALSGVMSGVDIYGAPGGIQVERTPNGVRYTGQPTDWNGDRQPLHAVCVRIDGGEVQKRSVDEIALR